MWLLPSKLEAVIPPLGAQRWSDDPIVYARYSLVECGRSWLVTEGQREGKDFHFYGYIVEWNWYTGEWGDFYLSELQAFRSPFGNRLKKDRRFTSMHFMSTWHYELEEVKMARRDIEDQGAAPSAIFRYVGLFCLGFVGVSVLVLLNRTESSPVSTGGRIIYGIALIAFIVIAISCYLCAKRRLR